MNKLTAYIINAIQISAVIHQNDYHGQLLLSTKDPQCIVIPDTKIYVLAEFKLSTFFVWSLFSYNRPCDILRRKKKLSIRIHATISKFLKIMIT